MTGILLRSGEETDMGIMSHEEGGGDRRDVATSQGVKDCWEQQEARREARNSVTLSTARGTSPAKS